MSKFFSKKFLVGVVIAALLSVSAIGMVSADDQQSIFASCPNGAYASIGGTGSVYVTFYYVSNSTAYTATYYIYLGGGSSSYLTHSTPASYTGVEVDGNATIYSAGCQ